jgi:outer membrane lipoprotein-sorting protein
MIRIIASLFFTSFALQAGAQAIPLSELSRYLNNLRTVQAGFTQINADGTLSTGTLYINRPGQVRFEYDPPENSLVMATGGQVAVFDPKSNQPPTHYPLRSTPLSIILAENVDLTRARMVTGHDSDGVTTSVTAQDPERPGNGSIRLVFTADPTELRQWVVTDSGGGQTTVVLSDMKTGVRLPRGTFDIVAETQRRVQ